MKRIPLHTEVFRFLIDFYDKVCAKASDLDLEPDELIDRIANFADGEKREALQEQELQKILASKFRRYWLDNVSKVVAPAHFQAFVDAASLLIAVDNAEEIFQESVQRWLTSWKAQLAHNPKGFLEFLRAEVKTQEEHQEQAPEQSGVAAE